MGIVIDLMTRLPVEIWFPENPRASDTKLESNIIDLVEGQTLLLLDRGFYPFHFWQQLIDKTSQFITRLKKGASIKVDRVFTNSYEIRERQVRLIRELKELRLLPGASLKFVRVKPGILI